MSIFAFRACSECSAGERDLAEHHGGSPGRDAAASSTQGTGNDGVDDGRNTAAGPAEGARSDRMDDGRDATAGSTERARSSGVKVERQGVLTSETEERSVLKGGESANSPP